MVFGRKGKDAVLEKVVKKQALEKEMKITEVGEGASWSVNEAEFFVLAPKGKEKSENNASIVIWAKFGGLKWLFTGDLEEEGEKDFSRGISRFTSGCFKSCSSWE